MFSLEKGYKVKEKVHGKGGGKFHTIGLAWTSLLDRTAVIRLMVQYLLDKCFGEDGLIAYGIETNSFFSCHLGISNLKLRLLISANV